MNILDENIVEEQRQLLTSWRIRIQQIGVEVGRKGIKDENQIIPLLHSLRQPVLLTRDMGFYNPRFLHRKYCVVCLSVEADEVASYVRRFLRHPAFNTKAKRMGKIVVVSNIGMRVWSVGEDQELIVSWDEH